MEIIYVLIPIAMIFVAIAVMVFFWAVKSEQFDDLDRQSVSILFDENTDKPGQTPTPVTQTAAQHDEMAAQQAIKNQQKGMPL
ncbi:MULTISPECIES: cbb3-type cytochrome oxidase assembly protein CcoS [Shewanella]|uniref:cbb3-type cytochrome oxidase assembly protein CcoS n=1 Tax=Shewanella TaxID=22 RepID=UPI0018E7AF01|nr:MULTISPECIES: cbb3-type cytochrome oxidase assembly protein CcoS [Shewanella]MCP3127308.1 cbb3-type cytochrome oxidase assembly protein CcoS [Shewanella sp. KJ2020]